MSTSELNYDTEKGVKFEDESSDRVNPLHRKFLSAISREGQRNSGNPRSTILNECIAEALGTMFIVVFGVGAVCSAVLLQEDVPLWHITVIWGFGVALAVLVTASVSGAHLNPAVSLAMAIFRPESFPFSKLPLFWLSQYVGGILGGAFNLMAFGPLYKHIENVKGFTRGSAASIESAKTFGEYFPAPGGIIPDEVISTGFALLIEAWGTGILTFVILSVTDDRQKIIRNKEMVPYYIGFTVAVLMTLYTPITQGGFNPARDLGPRIVAAMAGWGRIALPGPRNGFWIYIVGPKLGAVVGAVCYDALIRPGLSD